MKSRNRVNSYAARITKMIADIEDRHHGPKHPSETIVFHNEDGNPARANIKQALGYRKDGDGDGYSQPHKGVKASANSDVMYSFTSAQDGNPLQDDVRLCLGDDLKKAQDHSQRQASLGESIMTLPSQSLQSFSSYCHSESRSRYSYHLFVIQVESGNDLRLNVSLLLRNGGFTMNTSIIAIIVRSCHFKGLSNVGNVARLVTSKGIVVVVKRTTQMLVVRERGLRTNPKTKVDAIVWWIDSGAITHVCIDHCCVALEFSSGKTVTLFNVLYVPKLRKNLVSGPVLNKCGYKKVYESDKYILSKSGVFVGFGYYNNGMFMLNLNKVPDDLDSVYISSSTVVNSSLWHARLGYVHYKRMLEMSKDDLIPIIDENPEKCTTYRGGEYYDPVFFQSVGIIHETTTPYTPQQNGVAERKNKALKEMVNSLLSYSGLSEGFWREAMLTACYLLNMGCRAVVRLPDPKRKTLGKNGIDCIFVGYAEHSKAYRFYVIEPNDSVLINLIIESRDAIFDENRFSSIPRPKDIIPNVQESKMDDHTDDVPSEITKPRKEEDPRTYNEAMQSQDAAFWKEAIDDEIGSIIENNTWVLPDLPLGCKPLGCKWIFKRKIKVDVAHITTIRLLLALAAIHNLVIHQMDVKTTFLNGDLDDEVNIKQPEGFVMPGNEHKVCKLVKSLYRLKKSSKQWHQKFDEVVLSSGFHLNQSDKYIYSKLDSSGKGVIICLYVDDMLIFGTDQNQVDETKKFLSSRFSMKDMGEADVILGIKIKSENKGIVITQSQYIEKILKKFNREDCSLVNTLMDPVEKLKPNTGKLVDQLENSRAIGCLMYAMTSTRPDIAYVVGRLSRFTSNPSRQHWKAITMVFKYLRGTKDFGLSYIGYPSVLEGYSDASWINHVEDSSFTSGWVFLLGEGAISWASKKQTCITGFTMESEFVALAAAVLPQWLGHIVRYTMGSLNTYVLDITLSKIKAVKKLESPLESDGGFRSFLGWLGILPRKQELTFADLERIRLCKCAVLALPDGPDDFVVYCDASGDRIRYCILQERCWEFPSPSPSLRYPVMKQLAIKEEN
ncbi:zinc finger, CCHC-type containing protein [Tanacetum coccineum]